MKQQTLLDEQQVDLDDPPAARPVDPIAADRRRADQLLARAQAAIACATTTATDHT